MNETIAVVLSVTAGVYLYHLLEWFYYRISDKIWEMRNEKQAGEWLELLAEIESKRTKTKKKG